MLSDLLIIVVGQTLTLNKSTDLTSTCKASSRKDLPVRATSLVQIYDKPSCRCDGFGKTALYRGVGRFERRKGNCSAFLQPT